MRKKLISAMCKIHDAPNAPAPFCTTVKPYSPLNEEIAMLSGSQQRMEVVI
jgi:hypothetical protein